MTTDVAILPRPPLVTGTPVTPVLAFVQEDIGPVLPNLVLSPDEVRSTYPYRMRELSAAFVKRSLTLVL